MIALMIALMIEINMLIIKLRSSSLGKKRSRFNENYCCIKRGKQFIYLDEMSKLVAHG